MAASQAAPAGSKKIGTSSSPTKWRLPPQRTQILCGEHRDLQSIMFKKPPCGSRKADPEGGFLLCNLRLRRMAGQAAFHGYFLYSTNGGHPGLNRSRSKTGEAGKAYRMTAALLAADRLVRPASLKVEPPSPRMRNLLQVPMPIAAAPSGNKCESMKQRPLSISASA